MGSKHENPRIEGGFGVYAVGTQSKAKRGVVLKRENKRRVERVGVRTGCTKRQRWGYKTRSREKEKEWDLCWRHTEKTVGLQRLNKKKEGRVWNRARAHWERTGVEDGCSSGGAQRMWWLKRENQSRK